MTYPNSDSHSAKLFKRARQVIPDGSSRLTIKLDPYNLYLKSAQGAKVRDVDGHELIDFNNNFTSLIHGHAHPVITEAVQEQMASGTAFSFGSETEIELAELLCDRIPSIERIRFTNSGSEAVMNAIKAARAYTGRYKIAKCEGGYHGTYDFAEVSQGSNPTDWGNDPVAIGLAVGTPQSVLEEVVVIPFNEPETAERILEDHAEELAGILFDPLPNRIGLIPASREFVEMLQRFTRKYNVLLILDEVISLRNAYSGTQGLFGIEPDVTTIGKIIGGGFPVGGVAGRAEVMRVFAEENKKVALPHGGTFNANPITMVAGKTCMELLTEEAINQLNTRGENLRTEIGEVFKTVGLPGQATGAGSLFRIHLHNRPIQNYRDSYLDETDRAQMLRFQKHLINAGIFLSANGLGCLSTAMNDTDLEQFSEALLTSLRKIKEESSG